MESFYVNRKTDPLCLSLMKNVPEVAEYNSVSNVGGFDWNLLIH